MTSTNVRVSPKLQELQEAARIETRRSLPAKSRLTLIAGCVLMALVLALTMAG